MEGACGMPPYLFALQTRQSKLRTSLRRLCSQSGDAHRNTAQNLCSQSDTAKHSTASVQPIRCEKIKQWRRDRLSSDALVFRAAPASVVGYRLKKCLPWSASSMPPLGFQRLTPGLNLPFEHPSYTNFTLHNKQNRPQGKGHRPGAGNPVLSMLMCFDGNYNHANPFRNGRGRNQSVSSAIQLAGTDL
jgi:hypothetical protein